MTEFLKLCQRCGSEFQPRVEACLDCGGPLIVFDPQRPPPPRPEDPPSPPDETAAHELTGDDDPVALRRERMEFVAPLARRLRSAGIRCDVIAEPGTEKAPNQFVVYVATADREAAAAIDHGLLSEMVGDADFVTLADDACPACGTAREPGVFECPECGLQLDFAPDEATEEAQDTEEGATG